MAELTKVQRRDDQVRAMIEANPEGRWHSWSLSRELGVSRAVALGILNCLVDAGLLECRNRGPWGNVYWKPRDPALYVTCRACERDYYPPAGEHECREGLRMELDRLRTENARLTADVEAAVAALAARVSVQITDEMLEKAAQVLRQVRVIESNCNPLPMDRYRQAARAALGAALGGEGS